MGHPVDRQTVCDFFRAEIFCHDALTLTAKPNKSLDASGGGVFRNLLGAAQGALIRAAASTPPLGACLKNQMWRCL